MDISNVEAVGEMCIVEPIQVKETDSGIVRADQGHSTPVRGKVLKAGPRSDFVEGDVVYFRRYSVDELKFPVADGTEATMYLCENSDVCAIIRSKKSNWFDRLLAF